MLQGLTIAAGALLIFFGWWAIHNGGYFVLDSVLFSWTAIFCSLGLLLVDRLAWRRRIATYGLAFLGWVLLADVLSTEPLSAIARDVQWLILPLLIVVFRRLSQSSEEFLPILQITCAFSLLWISIYLFMSADAVFDWMHPPIFGNIRRLGMSVGVMTVFLYLDAGIKERYKFLLTLGRLIGLAMLFWAGGRGSFLGWAVAFAICSLAAKTGWQPLKKHVIEIGLALIFAVLCSVNTPGMGIWSGLVRPSVYQSGSLDQVSSMRLTLWSRTISVFGDPFCAVLGAGGNGFIRLKLMPAQQIFHPHNILLQAATDWGVIGLLLLSIVVLSVAHRVAACRQPLGRRESVGAGMLAFLLVTGLLDGGLYHLEYLIYAALAVSMLPSGHADAQSDKDMLVVPKVVVLVFLFGAVLLHASLRDYRAVWVNTPWSESVKPEGVCASGIR